jgi:hypothetical protein
MRTYRLQVRSLLLLITGLLLTCFNSGCSTTSAGRLASKGAGALGSFAAKATVATVKTTGKVAYATGKTVVQTTGDVAKTVVKSGFVTFRDTATGVSRQIPWQDGMKLYAASKTAQFEAGIKALQVLRGAQVFQSDWSAVKSGRGDLALQSGDLVKVVRN